MAIPVWVRAYRLVFGALAIWAVIRDFVDQHQNKPGFVPANFWSLFTNQSNLIAGAVLIGGAVLPVAIIRSHRWDMVRGAAVMFMFTTGVVYAALLGGLFNPFDGSHTWMNAVLHQLTPVVVVLDLLVRPPSTWITIREAMIWTVYPLLYFAYSLIRGPFVDWYPYTFINPHQVGGYGGVTLYAIAITCGFLAMTVLVVLLSRTPVRPESPASSPVPGAGDTIPRTTPEAGASGPETTGRNAVLHGTEHG